MMIICVLTGVFKDFFTFTIIILVHELGHITMALYYKWRIERVVILPFGGITIFHERLNRPLFEETLILLAGPLTQMIFYFLVSYWIKSPTFTYYHIIILLFNLLPIVPLDGAKALNLFCNHFWPFQKSYNITLIISTMVLICLCILQIQQPFNLLTYLILICLGKEIIIQYQIGHNVFNRYLFDCYMTPVYYPRRKVIQGADLHRLYRDHTHLFYIDQKYYTERQMLAKRFDLSKKVW